MFGAAAERMDAASATSHMRKLVPLIYIKRINISSGDAVTSRPLSQLANLPIHLNIGEEWECFSGLTLCTSLAREGRVGGSMRALSEFKVSSVLHFLALPDIRILEEM